MANLIAANYDDGTGQIVDQNLKTHPQPVVFKSSGFKKCLLASLVAGSTASRTSNVVTVTATAHGVPNTYNGFRFFYPGSPTLAAGWFDNATFVDANTITFASTGVDFGSESVNAGAAYVTATNIPNSIIIPAGYILDDTVGQLIVNTTSINTAASKTIRPFLGAQSFGPLQTGSTYFCGTKVWGFSMVNATQVSGLLYSNGNAGSGNISVISFNTAIDNAILLQLTVSAAQDFVAITGNPKIVLFN